MSPIVPRIQAPGGVRTFRNGSRIGGYTGDGNWFRCGLRRIGANIDHTVGWPDSPELFPINPGQGAAASGLHGNRCGTSGLTTLSSIGAWRGPGTHLRAQGLG